MLENFQGDSWGSIPPLRMPSLLPHDLCHGWSASSWLPAVIEFQLSYYRSSLNMQYAGSQQYICTTFSLSFICWLILWLLPYLCYCKVKVKESEVAQLYPTICDPMDCSQAPPSMGFSRQGCWSGLAFPSPGDLPDPGIEPGSPALQADALPSEPPGKLLCIYCSCK